MPEISVKGDARTHRRGALAAAICSAFLGAVFDAMVTRDPVLRGCIVRTLLTVAAYAGCIGLVWLSVALGLTDARLAALCTPLLAACPLGFYVAVRSGWTRRFKDPALTPVQMVFAVFNLAIAYAVNPHTRSATLLIVALVMAFGTFSLKPTQARRLAWLALASFGVEMIALEHAWPAIFQPNQETINFLALMVVMATLSTLSAQVARLRTSLRDQQKSLQVALCRVEELASHDALTGLLNRRFMAQRLHRELARLQHEPGACCVCLIDLDHFKRINDAHGHGCGDETLRCFAQQALACLRTGDVLARWGGEEFVLLLPCTEVAAACRTLGRLRDALTLPGAWHGRLELKVTFSAGVAQWGVGQTVERVLERADREAYRAKSEGRDRWCCAGPEAEAP
jgi:diguanylate cyclase (GGDEF)-like protein